MDRLNYCLKHGYDAEHCQCPAWLIAMGCMDMLIERQLEADPGFRGVLIARLRRGQWSREVGR